MTSLYNREKRGSQLDGKQYVFTFLCLTPDTALASLNVDLPTSISRIPGKPALALATPVPICRPLGDYCCGNDYYPESTRVKTKQETQQEQEHT